MNGIAAGICTWLLYNRFQLEWFWNLLFFLLVFWLIKSFKKALYKTIALVVVVGLIFLYPVAGSIPSLSPNKTYVILSENQEGDAVGTYQVNDYHLELVRSAFSEDSRFTDYGSLDEAYADLVDNRIQRLVVDKSIEVKRGRVVGEILAESEAVVAKDMSTEPFLVYISGLDTEESQMTRSRSDMNVLLAVNPITKEANLVSIARDTYLPLACQNGAMDKLTHAGLYGVDCQVRSIEALLDVEIDFYVRVHFPGFVEFIDTLGGVTINNPEGFDDFPRGLLELDGERALRYVRARDGVHQGDVGRGMNAQIVLNGVYDAIAASSNRAAIFRELFPIIDTNIDFSNALRMSKDVGGYRVGNHVLQGEGDMQTTYSQKDGFKYYVFWPDRTSLDSIHDMIKTTLKGE